jgi:hypothetical protein
MADSIIYSDSLWWINRIKIHYVKRHYYNDLKKHKASGKNLVLFYKSTPFYVAEISVQGIVK